MFSHRQRLASDKQRKPPLAHCRSRPLLLLLLAGRRGSPLLFRLQGNHFVGLPFAFVKVQNQRPLPDFHIVTKQIQPNHPRQITPVKSLHFPIRNFHRFGSREPNESRIQTDHFSFQTQGDVGDTQGRLVDDQSRSAVAFP